MSAPKVVFRVAKLKTWGQVSAAAAHNLRSRDTPNAGPAGLVEVVPLPADSAITAVRDRVGEQTIRKNAVLAVEVIVSASPAYFRPDCPERAGFYEPARLDAWRAAVEPWIAKEFPHAVSVVLHLDESTPHFQILDVPLDQRGKLNARAKYGGKVALAGWQDRAAGAVRSLGIERGLVGSLAAHERVQTFYGAANQPTPPLPAIKTPKPKPLPPRSLAERTPLTEAKATRDATEAAQNEQLAKRNGEIRARQQAQLHAWPLVAERSNAVDLAQRKQRQAEATAAAKAAEADKLREQADMLRALPLGEVLRRVYGAELKRSSKEGHRSRSYVLPDERTIGVSPADRGGEVWIEQGAAKGKRGAINLVMHLDGLDYRGAVRLLAEHFDTSSVATEHARALVKRAAREVAEVATDPVPVPPADDARWPGVRRWLTEARALPGRLVDWLRERGNVLADARGNAVFPRAGGGAFVRGTGPQPFYRSIGRKECGPFVIDGPGAAWICEAPIDAASIKAHVPDAHVVALGGSMLAPGEVRDFVPESRPVVLAFDADRQGRQYEQDALAVWPSAKRHPPPAGKDWNDALRSRPDLVAPAWVDGSSSGRSPSLSPLVEAQKPRLNRPPRPGG